VSHVLAVLHRLLLILPRSLPSTLFPYTTLFRSARTRTRLRRGRLSQILAIVFFAIHFLFLAASPHAQSVGGVEKSVGAPAESGRSEEHTSELQSRENLVCRLLLEKKKVKQCYIV